MANYDLCPRCQLNFIDTDTEEYCEVCRMELNGEKTFIENLDEADVEETELCPVCGENYMRSGERMCEECKKKSEYEDDVKEDVEEDPDKDDAWRSYLDDEEPEDDLGIDLSDEEMEEEEEIEESSSAEDDFEYVTADDYLDDDDDDDDDDDEDSFDDDDAPTPKSGSGKKRRRSDDDDF